MGHRVAMDTLVTVQVVAQSSAESETAVERALEWFAAVERTCSRFDPASELSQLSRAHGRPTPVSALLFEPLRFALALAEATNGAFDPTVGDAMVRAGFARNYASGSFVAAAGKGPASYRDIELDEATRSVTLLRPLTVDLGAVAKGLAIDLAARELAPFGNFLINAGGDIFAAGLNPDSEPWSVGIRHPRELGSLMATIAVSGLAVCTSGDYERPAQAAAGHHLLDPRSGESASSVASVTCVAPTAMAADALGTAAFVLGPAAGLELFRANDVEGLIVTPQLEAFATDGWMDLLT
jgi:thiamine biosynthesis lipoprotein